MRSLLQTTCAVLLTICVVGCSVTQAAPAPEDRAPSLNKAYLQGEWVAVSAAVSDARDGHRIDETMKRELVRTDRSLVLTFGNDSAGIRTTVPDDDARSIPFEFTGTWQYQQQQNVLNIQTGDVDWEFRVTDISGNTMTLSFSMPMMDPNHIHRVQFERR